MAATCWKDLVLVSAANLNVVRRVLRGFCSEKPLPGAACMARARWKGQRKVKHEEGHDM
eukprot:COSAG06_NODE_66195_length_255_cov_0.602564_1_plen_58_part_10